jgi:HEAT repeat protein
LLRRVNENNPPISRYGEKFQLWSPDAFLRTDAQSLEAQLADLIPKIKGEFVENSQGLGDTMLRQPNTETLDAVVSLLDSNDSQIQLAAAHLTSLYLQSVSGSDNRDSNSYAIRVQFHSKGHGKALSLLYDSDPRVRNAAALILGNTIGDGHTAQLLSEAFDKETDSGVKWVMAWAYWKLRHNYDRARG